MRIVLAVFLAGGAAGASPTAAPQFEQADIVERTEQALGAGVQRGETERFIVLSDGDSAWTRSTALLLEQTHDRFRRFLRHLGVEATEPGAKLLCVLIEDQDRFQAFALAQDQVQARWIGGYYAPHTNRVVFFHSATAVEFEEAERKIAEIDREAEAADDRAAQARRSKQPGLAEAYRVLATRAKEDAARHREQIARQASAASSAKTTHEAAHLLSFNLGLQSRARHYPFWLSEGLAVCFEASSPEDARSGKFGPDRVNQQRQQEFDAAAEAGTLVPLEAFVEMLAAPPGDESAARVMYAQAYALYRWLFRYERQALAEFYRDIEAEGPGAIPPRRQGELFTRRFGPPEKLERRWLKEAVDATGKVAQTPVSDE